jgi:hypothetical protein
MHEVAGTERIFNPGVGIRYDTMRVSEMFERAWGDDPVRISWACYYELVVSGAWSEKSSVEIEARVIFRDRGGR